jgi:hypothetical protein
MDRSWTYNDCFPYVVQMLQRRLLRIYENCELRDEMMVSGNERGKVGNCILYTWVVKCMNIPAIEKVGCFPMRKLGTHHNFLRPLR